MANQVIPFAASACFTASNWACSPATGSVLPSGPSHAVPVYSQYMSISPDCSAPRTTGVPTRFVRSSTVAPAASQGLHRDLAEDQLLGELLGARPRSRCRPGCSPAATEPPRRHRAAAEPPAAAAATPHTREQAGQGERGSARGAYGSTWLRIVTAPPRWRVNLDGPRGLEAGRTSSTTPRTWSTSRASTAVRMLATTMTGVRLCTMPP